MFPRVEGKPLTWSTSSRKAAFALGDVSQSSPGNLSARLYQVFFSPFSSLNVLYILCPVSSWVEQLIDAVIFEVPVGFLKADYLFSSLLL